MSKAIAVLAAAVLMTALLIAPSSGAAPWSLFGAATPIRSGAAPNPWAVQLVSDTTIMEDGNDYSGILFQDPGENLTFSDIYGLSTDLYKVVNDCLGGSPRFQIGIDYNNNGVWDGNSGGDGNIHVYLGEAPSFTNCPNTWDGSGNLIGLPDTDKRYDLTQVGGAFYDTYNNALSMHGGKKVFYIALIVDGGWAFTSKRQVINVDKVVVNQHALVARGFRQ